MTLNENWNLESGEQRTEEYRRWRTELGIGAVCDLDQIEYLTEDGIPIAVLELCVADYRSDDHPHGIKPGGKPTSGFFAACEEKVSDARGQGRTLRYIAKKLEVPLLLVCYIHGDLERGFWIHKDGREGWDYYTLKGFEEALRQKHALERARLMV